MNLNTIKSLQLNFILCMERTGSSMLTMMLNRNESVLSPSEEPFMLYLYREYHAKSKWTKKEIDQFIVYFERIAEKNLTLYFSPLENLKQQMLENREDLNFHALTRLIYSLFLPLLKKYSFTHIIDKQIKYILYSDVLEQLLPESRYVILVRDPRAVIASWKKRELGLSKQIAYMAKIWVINYQAVLHKIQNNPHKYLLVKYEDLVLKNEQTLQQICAHFNIPFQKEMLEHHELPSPDPTSLERLKTLPDEFVAKIKAFHQNTLSPINESLISEWENTLNPQEIRVINRITHNVATQYGYNIPKVKAKLGVKNRLSILFAVWEKKVYLYLYVKSPLWLKSLVKKYRPNIRKE